MSETRIPGASRICVRALSSFVLLGAFGCSSVDEEPGTLRGRFVETIARFPDGHSQSTYFLAQGKERTNKQKLVFDEAPEIFPNTEIKVWGTNVDGRFEVDRFEVVGDAPVKGPLGKSQQALIDAAPIAPTNMVMVMVDTSPMSTGLALTREAMNAELFSETDPTSLVHYYLENSYGMHTLTGQVAPGTYTYQWNGECDYDAMAESLIAQVHTDTGVPEFDLYLWYWEPNNDACSWSGLSSGQDTFYNDSSGCVVLAQEPGHSFGLAHSSSLFCQGAAVGDIVPFVDDPTDIAGDNMEDDDGVEWPGPNQCIHNEYGNRYDTMGGGCRHFSAYQKVYRTYLQGCNVAQVQRSGTFTLHPIESPCNGVQVIQVPMAKVRAYDSEGGGGGDRTTNLAFYNVELRSPIGAFDGSSSPMVPSVLINAAPDWRIFGQGGGGRGMSRGEHIWLLDMAPTVADTGGGRGGGSRNGSAHGLAVGQTFTDPAGGVRITTEAVSATSATIRVDIDGSAGSGGATGGAGAGGAGTGGVGGTPMMAPPTIATCLDDTPLLAPGPAECGGSYAGMAGMAGSGGLAGGGAGGLAGGGAGGAGGIAGSGLGGTAGAGAVAGSGTAGAGQVITPEAALESGCGCRVLGDRGSNGRNAAALALLGILTAALGRRRRINLPQWL